MLHFRKLSITDRAWAQPFIEAENSRSADYNFGNIYMWDGAFRQHLTSVDGRLLTKLRYEDMPFFAFPIGSGDVKPSIEALTEFAAHRRYPLAIRGITDLPLDVHLMIDRPIRYVERFCKAGADILTVHVEADTEENTRHALEIIRDLGVRPAICVKPKTPAEAVLPFIDLCSLILVMTVEPGFGGQSFMADMMPKVEKIRAYINEKNPACELEVDGGVNEQTAEVCKAAGANVLVAGSAYFKAADKAAFARSIQK